MISISNKKLNFEELDLSGVFKIIKNKFSDDRGHFFRLFCEQEFKDQNMSNNLNQINLSTSAQKGTVRGLHYQTSPFSEQKIVTCIKGKIWDVAVDIRKESPTYLKWTSLELSAENYTSILIPEGFAHGFQTLESNSEILYFSSKPYMKEFERGINPLDKKLKIDWPIKISNISSKDKNQKFLT